MEVNPNLSAGSVPRAAAQPPAPPPAQPVPADSASFREAAAVHGAWQRADDVRPEAVDKAARLGRDLRYPPLETINAIANLLALNLDAEE